MKRRKKGFLIVLVVLLLIGAVGFIVWSVRNQDTGNAETNTVFVDSVSALTGLGSTGVIQKFAGVVEPQETWNVENSSDRTIAEVYVKVGDTVKAGDQLFTYDTTEAKDSLIEGEIEIDRLNGDIAGYQSQIETLQADKAKAAAADQLDIETQIQTIQNQLRRAQYDLQKQQVTNANLEETIANSTVTSEIDGLVQSINDSDSASYSYGDESNAYMTIIAVGDYRIRGTINEQNRDSLVEGSPVIVYSRANENEYWKGTLSEIDYDNPIEETNSYSMSSSDSMTQSSNYPFYVELDSIDGLMMGQHVYIEMDYGQADGRDGMWLNEYYIVQDDGDPYVWAANSRNQIEKRTVTLGEYDEDQEKYEILSGLSADDYIAFPNDSISEGDAVELNVDQTSNYFDANVEDSYLDEESSDFTWDSETDAIYYEDETGTDTFFDDAEMDEGYWEGETGDLYYDETETDTEIWEDASEVDAPGGIADELDIQEYTEAIGPVSEETEAE